MKAVITSLLFVLPTVPAVSASAGFEANQDTVRTVSAEKTVNTGAKSWKERLFLQAIGGANLSMNEDLRFGSFDHSLNWGTEWSIGKEFTPYWGMIIDLAYNKNAGSEHYSVGKYYNFNSMNLFVNATYNLTNGFLGLRKERKSYLYGIVGLGAGYTFTLKDRDYNFSKADNNLAAGLKLGLSYVYNFTRHVGAVASAGFCTYTDNYNGRTSGIPFDSRLDLSVGIRINLGKGAVPWTSDPVVKYVDRIVHHTDTVTVVERIVERIGEHATHQQAHEAKIYSIFFAINSIDIRDSEKGKIDEMASYLKEHPGKKLFVLGYADQNTGNEKLNYYLGKNRSLMVAKYLIENYGVVPSRIINITEEGDKVQPYKLNYENNRVAICIIGDFTEEE